MSGAETPKKTNGRYIPGMWGLLISSVAALVFGTVIHDTISSVVGFCALLLFLILFSLWLALSPIRRALFQLHQQGRAAWPVLAESARDRFRYGILCADTDGFTIQLKAETLSIKWSSVGAIERRDTRLLTRRRVAIEVMDRGTLILEIASPSAITVASRSQFDDCLQLLRRYWQKENSSSSRE